MPFKTLVVLRNELVLKFHRPRLVDLPLCGVSVTSRGQKGTVDERTSTELRLKIKIKIKIKWTVKKQEIQDTETEFGTKKGLENGNTEVSVGMAKIERERKGEGRDREEIIQDDNTVTLIKLVQMSLISAHLSPFMFRLYCTKKASFMRLRDRCDSLHRTRVCRKPGHRAACSATVDAAKSRSTAMAGELKMVCHGVVEETASSGSCLALVYRLRCIMCWRNL
ncbi:hypothetical protein M514_11322 [Trichuris suis]|uniref:Uncharacterized protein n=1 Tax=Trichuris suis TaxID=68888 RepID=A0A085MXP2_9BILA|nr:hypothetical protein M514_11322 [Trichuris suis]